MLGLGAAVPQAMVGAKAAGHLGGPETSSESRSKKHSSTYVEEKGRVRTPVKLVRKTLQHLVQAIR